MSRELATLQGLIAEKLEEIIELAAILGVKFERATFIGRTPGKENSAVLVTDEDGDDALQEAFDWAVNKTEKV